jgi:serine/threonine protein kinase
MADVPRPTNKPVEFDGPEKAGAVVAGKYTLVRKVARGGMGSVWEAFDQSLERAVAMKFMAPAIASEENLRQRFNREAKAAARLRTPHVVQVYEHGVDDDTPYIVMELLDGEDLHTRLRRGRRIDPQQAAIILAQMAKGLRAAHDANIIHRDLKPHNVFLAQEDGDMVVKILDFGVAKMADVIGEGTKTGAVLGSPHYMSPEQARGLPVDHRSDVWSMACIAFRMVTGKMAFKGQHAGDVIVKICSEPLPVPSDYNPQLTPQMDAFFGTAMQRDPERRFQSAMALASAFAEALGAPAKPSPLASSSKARQTMSEDTTANFYRGDVADIIHEVTGSSAAPLSATPPFATNLSNLSAQQHRGAMLSTNGSQPDIVSSPSVESSPGAAQSNPDFTGPRQPHYISPVIEAPISHASYPDGTPITGHSVAGVVGSVPPSHLRQALEVDADPGRKRRVALVASVTGAALIFTIVAAFGIGGADSEPDHATAPAEQPPTSVSASTPPRPAFEVPAAPSASASAEPDNSAAPDESAPDEPAPDESPKATDVPVPAAPKKIVPRSPPPKKPRPPKKDDEFGY